MKQLCPTQATAAMKALKPLGYVGGRTTITFGEDLRVTQAASGVIRVAPVKPRQRGDTEIRESYRDIIEFAAAYDVQWVLL
jgi:hypothetical protein